MIKGLKQYSYFRSLQQHNATLNNFNNSMVFVLSRVWIIEISNCYVTVCNIWNLMRTSVKKSANEVQNEVQLYV